MLVAAGSERKAPDILRLREAIARARTEERDARQMAIALGEVNAPEKDLRYAHDREASAARRKRRLIMELRVLLLAPTSAAA
jgi:hypothetical protein